MANYSNNYTTNTTNLVNGTETYKVSRAVSAVNSESMDNSCIYCGAENGTVYDYFPTYEVNSDPAKKAAIDSLWTFGGGVFSFTSNAKETPYNICFALVNDNGDLNDVGNGSVYQIGKQIYNKQNPENTSHISVLNPVDIRKVIFIPSFEGYASGSPDAQLVTKDLAYLLDHPDNFWITAVKMTSVMWDGSEYTVHDSLTEKIRPCIVGDDFFLPVSNIFSVHHFDTTFYNSQKQFTQAYYGVYDTDGMPMSFAPIQSNESLAYNTELSYGGMKTPNNNRYYYNYNDYTSKVQLTAPARQIIKLLAYCGCYFADNNYNISGKTLSTMWNDEHIYLGEMNGNARTTGNFIKGTDILTSNTINKGEFSSQTTFDPSGGGGGGGTGDELTEMLSRGQFYGSGLTKYYVDVPAAKLQKALGDWDNIETGKDVLQNLLSYKILCFPSTTFSNGMTDPFVIAGTELKDENNNTITAKRLTSTGAVDLPRITITPTFNDFRDYAPYTKLQMFVPLCGWFDLPPWCMGRTISGEMYINPYSGTVRCLVRADGNVVAELGGNAAIDLPFNATAVGMKSAAVLSNLIQTAGAVGRAIMLPTVNTLAGAGSAALGAVCAMNANYTESKGTMGDGSNVYGLYHVFIKITRPATVDNTGNSLVTIPDQYCHDYGRPCNKQLKLAEGDGYTQIMDANITGSMTDREKQMIIDGFRHGLIL